MPDQPVVQSEAVPEGGADAEWRAARCPLCGGGAERGVFTARNQLFGTDATVSLAQCGCGMLMTDPQPVGETLAAFYQTDAYYTHGHDDGPRARLRRLTQRWQMHGFGAACRLRAENWFGLQRFTKRLAPGHFALRRGQRLLDFGCGDGRFVALCAELGLDAVGVEPDSQARAAADLNGARVFESLEALDALRPGARFERIQLKHVLEHLPDPIAVLETLGARLTASGRMLIAVPNADSEQAEVFRAHWIGYDMPRHLWHFTPSTLSTAVSRAGLSVVELETIELAWFVRESAIQQRNKGGEVSAYHPGSVARLETAGRGAEIVAVLEREC